MCTCRCIKLIHYSDTSSNFDLRLDHTYSKEFPARPGDKVRLLVNSQVVGIGTLGEGNQLHCHQIPPEFITLSIDEIDDCIFPMYMTSFDEPFLYVGQFTAWPIAQLQFLQT